MEFLLFFLALFAFLYFVRRGSGAKPSPAASQKGRKARGKSHSQEGLTFEREKKEPEIDSMGRVVVRLDGGSQLEFDVRLRVFDSAIRYLLGKPKDEEILRSVRARVVADVEYQSLQVFTPAGDEIGEVLGSEKDNALKVFAQLESALKRLSNQLIGKPLVFDVSLQIEGEWQEDSEEESGWLGEVYSATIRIKDPAGIDIR